MKYLLLVLALIFFLGLLGCFKPSQEKVMTITDQNAQIELRLVAKSNYGIFIPPEPPELINRTITLYGFVHEKQIFSITLPTFELDVKPGLACDVRWSKNYEYFAVKTTNCILIYNNAGKKISSYFSNKNEKISSINWNNKGQLLAIIKDVERQDTFGYTISSTYFKLISILPKSEPVTLFSKTHYPVTFIFNGLEFNNQEISPDSNYFVFSTGLAIEFYDLSQSNISTSIDINKALQGIWWLDEDELVLGCDILSSNGTYFYYRISRKELRDITNTFKNWDTNDVYSKDWYYNTFKKLKLRQELTNDSKVEE